MNVGFHGKRSLLMTSQNIEGYARDQVDLRVQADLLRAPTLVLICDHAVERLRRRLLRGVHGHMEFHIQRQGQTDDIEARSDIGGRAWRPQCEGGATHSGLMTVPDLEVRALIFCDCGGGRQRRG